MDMTKTSNSEKKSNNRIGVRMKLSVLLLALMLGLLCWNLPSVTIQRNKDSGIVGLQLRAPPLEAYADYTPLNTSAIGLICYYFEPTGWNLSSVVGALENYTNFGNYIDGYIRVWEDATGGTYVGSDVYIDLQARIRQDGYILSWLPRNASYSYALYWGFHHKGGVGPVVDNATSMGRAIQRVYASASKSWVGFNVLTYYDFQYSTATRLVWAGRYQAHSSLTADLTVDEVFYNLLNNITAIHTEFCWLYYVTGVREWLYSPWFDFRIMIDFSPIYTRQGNYSGTNDLIGNTPCPFAYDPLIRHRIELYCYQTFDGNSHTESTTFWFMLWL